MKTIIRIVAIFAIVAGLIYSAFVIVNDARTHQGAFMTTAQYRQEVAEIHK